MLDQSEIVKCSDVERALAAKESDLTKTLYFSQSELTGLLTVANFQKDIDNGNANELHALMLEKQFLENEIRLLEEKNNGLKNSMLAFVEGIRSANTLQVDTQRGSRENEKLVKNIDNMKTSLPSSFDYSNRYVSGARSWTGQEVEGTCTLCF
ncbi:CAP-Gly domain-containing linker protein 1 [Pyrus ussuriensis x Pyrus communis]|uniref:CAP-Gly domain-containing linker protein 1 n=1 Tax=Pyrus ussuriensis x Pyrus communis TaxID=2448454 RepID=A0A5N5I0G8_9ROSA|nr:CAP-Gly domain-containing linker protein 1 [Pyrus ussuriensis x Pyrus communis]